MKTDNTLITRFIHPFIWQGYCWIDGGLGRQEAGEGTGWKVTKAVINPMMRYVTDPKKSGTNRIFLTPDSQVFLSNDDVPDQHGLNPRYCCSFAGPDFQQLVKMIQDVAGISDSQVWVFDAYLPDGQGNNQTPFRLWIRQGTFEGFEFKEPVFKILSGTMVPDFSKSLDIAGW